MKRTALMLSASFIVAACGSTTPVLKVDDLWTEREKSKAEFQKKYAGKEIVVAGTYTGSKPTFDFKNNSQGYEEISVYGSWGHVVHCQIEEKDAAGFKDLAGKGEGLAVKGKLVSAEDDAYPELRPCSMDLRK
jgi:hypothetical protein